MIHVIKRIREMFPRSFLGEFQEVFGEDATRKLLDIFSGTTIEVPARRTLENAERDIIIYETLYTSTSMQQSKERGRKLADKYKLSRERVREIFRHMKKQMGENKRFRLADECTGKRKRSKVQVEHRSRRKL